MRSTRPFFGFGSNWTTSRTAATTLWGATNPHFGGDRLFAVRTAPRQLLDLRVTNPWAVLADATGFDEADYDTGELGHDLLYNLRRLLAGQGFDWYAHWEFGSDRHEWITRSDIWVYLGADNLPAEEVVNDQL